MTNIRFWLTRIDPMQRVQSWKDGQLVRFDAMVTNVANSYRLQVAQKVGGWMAIHWLVLWNTWGTGSLAKRLCQVDTLIRCIALAHFATVCKQFPHVHIFVYACEGDCGMANDTYCNRTSWWKYSYSTERNDSTNILQWLLKDVQSDFVTTINQKNCEWVPPDVPMACATYKRFWWCW